MNNSSIDFISSTQKALTKTKFQFVIDDASIIEFNKNLGIGGTWGEFNDPFRATHFMTVESQKNGQQFNADTILVFEASSEVSMNVVSKSKGEGSPNQIEIDYIKLSIIGNNDFKLFSPRQAWREILDLKKTDGAISEDGSFFLGESRGTGEFMLVTCDKLNKFSFNLEYQVGFTIIAAGQPNRYCVIDPLIKTSSEDDG